MPAASVRTYLLVKRGGAFLTPIAAVDYGASVIVAKEGDTADQGDGTDVSVASAYRVVSSQRLAPDILVGKRMPSVKVLNQSDARPWHFQELLPSNGRWRVVVFPGDISQSAQKLKLEKVGAVFADKKSFLSSFTPPKARYDEVFEVLAVHSAPRTQTTIFDFPEVFRQYDEFDGWDYMKIYVDDESYHEGHGKIYETFGISKDGCIIILRPDQYVSYLGPMDDPEAVNKFFSGFMQASKSSSNGILTNGPAKNDVSTNGVLNNGVSTNGVRAQAVESMPL